MRITAGRFGGKKLLSPEGLTTRPTSDRARQAVFNILRHASWLPGDVLNDAQVMDLFAGTGAMGLEALSQGAAHAIFVEQDAKALKCCRDNIANCNVTQDSKLLNGSALSLPLRSSATPQRTLVFLDPPYGKGYGVAALHSAVAQGWLAADAVIVMEMAKKEPETPPSGFTVHDTRDYGVARVMFMTYDG